MLRFDLILGISCHLVQSLGKPHSSRSIGSECGICKNKNTDNRQTTSKHNKTKQQILSPLYATSLHPHSRLSRKNVAVTSVDSWIIYIYIYMLCHACCNVILIALQWRHDERDGVSNHHRLHCLSNCWFGVRTKETSKLRVTGLCVGNTRATGEFLKQKASNAENVSVWWRHRGLYVYCLVSLPRCCECHAVIAIRI